METPILNKKQQFATLSAKKFKLKHVVIKNILDNPYDYQYWPEVGNEDYDILKTALKTFLPRVRLPKVNIPWKQLMYCPKPERKQMRLEIMKKMGHSIDIDISESDGLVLGVNDITKCLEKNTLDAVLIASDVHPRIMVQHLIEQSVLNGIFVLVVKDMRTLTKDKCGVKSAALGIEKNLSCNSKLNVIKNTIQEISEHYPVPVDHIHCLRTLKFSEELENMDATIETIPKKMTINVDSIRKKFYLMRENKCKRTFEPKRVARKSSRKMKNVCLPYKKQKETQISIYKSLKVKRIKNDVLRGKRINKALNKIDIYALFYSHEIPLGLKNGIKWKHSLF